jgi:hypothetical protein
MTASARQCTIQRLALQKVRRRETREVIIGGVLGPITRPDVVIAGQYSKTGELLIVGRTVPLTTTQSAQLGAVLSPAGPDHPWPDQITSYRWGGKDALKHRVIFSTK